MSIILDVGFILLRWPTNSFRSFFHYYTYVDVYYHRSKIETNPSRDPHTERKTYLSLETKSYKGTPQEVSSLLPMVVG